MAIYHLHVKVDRGMIADLNVHWDIGEDGQPKPHAHIMLTMRSVSENGFGPGVRDWNRTEMVERWRERWAELANERLAELDIDARIDHRSLEAQGIALEPQSQIGAPAQRIETRSVEGEGIEAADRAEMHREIARGNGARIIADPHLALDAITHQQSTFTRRDMAKFAHRHSDGIDQFNEVMGAMRNAPDLVELGQDGRGEDRFTTRQMIEAEQRLHRAAELMTEKERHEVNDRDREAALARAEQRGLVLSGEQADYEQRDPAQNYAERRGITFRERVAEIVRKIVPEKLRERIDGLIDGLRSPVDDALGSNAVQPERGGAEPTQRQVAAPARDAAADDPEVALRKARTDALKRHARAVDAIFSADDMGRKASPEQWKELVEARRGFDEVRPHGWQDAEAAYAKDGDLAREAGSGRVNRAIRALQLETEIRTDPQRRADRFVERWQKLDQTSQRQYQAGDMSGYKATRSAMGDMAKSLERDPQLESILAGRRQQLGISVDFDSGRRLGQELAFTHGIDLGMGRGIGL